MPINSGMNDCIDTAYLMQMKGYDVYTVEGSAENIKITTLPISIHSEHLWTLEKIHKYLGCNYESNSI